MANSVLRQTIHTAVAKTILNEIGTRAVKYYFSYGRTHDWGGINVQDALDTLPYELGSRKNTVFLKEVTPGDACLVIPRYNWVSGATYDPYDAYSNDNVAFSGAKSLEEAVFYVVTDELNVYKCLDNANNSASTVKPTGTATNEIITSDNYVWKYMYSIPTTLSNKFLSTTLMPVANAVTKMFYSDGKLERFFIENKGSGYLPNVTQEGTVASSETITNYRKLFGNNTNFLGKVRSVDSYTGDGTTSVSASLASPALTMTSFIGDGTRLVTAVVSSTTSLSKDDFVFIEGAAAQNILTVTSIAGNGSQNVVVTTSSTITGIQIGETLTISGAVGTQQSKLNGAWEITDKVGSTLTIRLNTTLATGTYTSDIGVVSIPTRAVLNGTWKIINITSGTTFVFQITDGTTLTRGTHKSSIGTTEHASKYNLLRVGDSISISGAVGTEQTKLNGSWIITEVTNLVHIKFTVSSTVATGTYTSGLGTLKHSSKIDGLNPNDYIEVNGEVRQIASIESDVELTLKSAGPLLYVGQDSILTKLNTYLEISDGDGYIPENPYIISGATVTAGGSGYTQNSPGIANTAVVFTSPQLAGGRVAQATATVSVAGVVTGITLTDPGYGYTVPPTATIVDNIPGGTGGGATLSVVANKSVAYLEPTIGGDFGEILGIIPKYPGIGYTFGTVTIRRYNEMTKPSYVTSWTDATITPDFNIGKLDSKQADVELSAINGGIHYIKVTQSGVGYTQGATVTITGDGTGCTAIPAYDISGTLNRIIITNPGKEYTEATVTITPNEGSAPSTVAQARAIISPPGGHGKSAIDELIGRTISFFSRLTYDLKIKSMDMSSVGYRQLLLYRQPKVFGSQALYSGSIGSTVYKLVVTKIGAAPDLSTIALGSVVKAATSAASDAPIQIRFRVVTRTTNELLLQSIDSNDEQLTTTLQLIHPNGVNAYTINAIQKPDVEKLSGEVIYIDNRQEFKPLVDQTVSISSRFKF